MSEEEEEQEIIDLMDIDYEEKLFLAERVYNYVKTAENEGKRLTSGVGYFDDINQSHKDVFIRIVELVIGQGV